MLTIGPIPPPHEITVPDNPNRVRLYVRRDDLSHPVVSGNKWRKLCYNLAAARQQGHDTLLTFGGAYSNHLHAVAGAAQEAGFKSIGIVRGEEHLPLNPTLRAARHMGMALHYMDRTTYRQKHTPEVIRALHEQFGRFYLIPEGGTNRLALQGAAEMVTELDEDYDYYCLPCGTGGTAAGVISGLQGQGQVLAFSVLKGDFHTATIKELLKDNNCSHLANWQVITDYHFGGYARFTPDLIGFINDFKKNYHIPLDPIYTGKLFYGLFDLIANGFFKPDSRILAYHTGGLQGIDGFNERFGPLIET